MFSYKCSGISVQLSEGLDHIGYRVQMFFDDRYSVSVYQTRF